MIESVSKNFERDSEIGKEEENKYNKNLVEYK